MRHIPILVTGFCLAFFPVPLRAQGAPNPMPFPRLLTTPVVEFDDTFDLPAGTRFDPGLWWFWGEWPPYTSPGPAEHNGQGWLALRGQGVWGHPALSTAGGAFYPIRDDADVDYQIDFRVLMPTPGTYYLGAASWVRPGNSRGFLLREDGQLAVSTDQVGSGLGNGWNTEGVDTGLAYPIDAPFTLRIILQASGGAIWRIDTGGGFTTLTPQSSAGNPVSGADLDTVTTWPLRAGGGIGDYVFADGFTRLVTHYLMIDAKGNSVGGAPQILVEDDFTDPPGNMSPAGQNENINPLWRWNETAGFPKNVYDGTTSLLMPMQGQWKQYIDAGLPENLNPVKRYALICLFTMPTTGTEGFGFTRDGSMTSGDPTRIFKLRGGKIYLSRDMWSTADDLDTGQTYAPDTPQGLMMVVDEATGKLQLYHQNGADKATDSTAWTEITPATDTNSLLNFNYGYNKIGVNCAAGAGATFRLDYIGLIGNPTWPGVNVTESQILLDRVTVTASAVTQCLFRNGLRSGTVFRSAQYAKAPAPPLLPEGFWSSKKVLEDEFNGDTGTPPGSLWNYNPNGGSYIHDGQGRLIGTKRNRGTPEDPQWDPQWNSPYLQSKFSFPNLGTKDYFVEFRLTVPQYQHNYLGLGYSDGSTDGLRHYRAFLLTGASDGNNGTAPGKICLQLNQDPGFQCGWGLETDRTYPINQPFGLLIWIRAGGKLAWYCDFGSGWQSLRASANNAAWDNVPMALSWTRSAGRYFFIKIDCNGWLSTTTPNLILDRVAVYESNPLPDPPLAVSGAGWSLH